MGAYDKNATTPCPICHASAARLPVLYRSGAEDFFCAPCAAIITVGAPGRAGGGAAREVSDAIS